ncbi:P-loop containing nucleoside triphosphate hydrolase protein [Calocera viscosa TUFC12733]|uniref:Signal recognition particle receptor subunit beta n=1 Tax=Calocera viscosa (strain TUFC12733) TaxID=1330018 RepID=A0A167NMH4_CALVF|nr:P-loop containing nucleoside triphosphate hydrolase protein [Calocera viscosa TUFC12733]
MDPLHEPAAQDDVPTILPEVTPLPAAIVAPFWQDPIFLAAALGLLLALIVTIYLLNKKSQKDRIKSVLLVGPSDSGKTALFTNVVYQQHLASHTSLQANIGLFQQDSKLIRVIDIPGHPRLRNRFKEHLATVDGVVFTVDANTVARNGAIVAEHLHLVLSAVQPLSRPPRLFLLATKADLVQQASLPPTDAAGPYVHPARTRVVSVLERELEKRRLAGTNQKSGGAMEALGAVAGGEKGGLFGSSAPAETEELAEGVLEAGRDGVWRFGDEWEMGVSWVGTGETEEGLRPLRDWMDSL